jgi:hypothetical protein
MKTRTLNTLFALFLSVAFMAPAFAAGSYLLPEGEKDTVTIESNGTKIIIQTDSSSDLGTLSGMDIASVINDISVETEAAAKEMEEEFAKIRAAEAVGEIDEDEAEERREAAQEKMELRLEAMEDDLETQLEALELFSEEVERRVMIEALEDEENDWDSDDWEGSWEDDGDDDWEDDWDMDWNWDSDNGDPTVGYFDFSIGLNNYVDADGAFPTAGDDLYALNTWSMHWGLGFGGKTRLGNENSPAQVKYGIEMAWTNYAYDRSVVPIKTADEVLFVEGVQQSYNKNKMNITSINVPLMLQLDWSGNRGLENGFNLGIGGYAGFRIGSNSKAKYRDENNEKVKIVNKSNFYLNDFNYGLQAQIGIGGVNLFARYALNTLFQENRGPELTPVVFGIVL